MGYRPSLLEATAANFSTVDQLRVVVPCLVAFANSCTSFDSRIPPKQSR
jgi:hypothetical protein